MKELTVKATTENVAAVTEFAESCLEEVGCPMKSRMQIDVAIDEIYSNIARYAYSPAEGDVTVRIEIGGDPLAAEITFIDSGLPFDPLKRGDPDVTLSAEERGIGGLGIFVVKKIMDDVAYAYRDGKNMLTIRKVLGI